MGTVFAAILVLAATDVLTDLGEGTTLRHVALELLVIAAGVVGLAIAVRRYAELRRREVGLRAEARELGERLAATRADAARWRAEWRHLVDGLGAAIEQQFVAWGLSTAERGIASLLLKGLSHKEVAAARRVSEATVRQQARSVYRKAGVEGRHDLAAFFLEELLPPHPGSGELS
ncbi:MAG: response regulator transcription factor [Planctomycetes bacterium]|nr:response regulator transcription factor [Planctomycetota bacterium]